MGFVRVKLPQGGEASCSESFAESHGLEIVDKPSSRFGSALPAKPKVSKGTRRSRRAPVEDAGVETGDVEGGSNNAAADGPEGEAQ